MGKMDEIGFFLQTFVISRKKIVEDFLKKKIKAKKLNFEA